LLSDGDPLFDPLADHIGAVRVGADRDKFSAQLAEAAHQRLVRQGAFQLAKKSRNVDFEGFFILYQNFKYRVYLFAMQAQIGHFAGSGDDIDDPWYTGDFETTYQDVLRGCEGLLSQILGN